MKIQYIAISICCLLFSSCIKEEWGIIPEQQDITEKNEWNKNKTVDFYFISALNDKTIGNYNAISNFINSKNEEISIAIVDRSDVENYQRADVSIVSPTNLSVLTNKFSSFAFQKYTDTSIEGSTILFNHKINSEECFKVKDDCYIKFVPIMTKSNVQTPVNILVPFATIRFNTKEQVNVSTASLQEVASKHNAVIIGTIKKNLIADLEKQTTSLKGYKLSFAIKDAENDYTIFILAPSSWVLRETVPNGIGNLNAYKISIEASVE